MTDLTEVGLATRIALRRLAKAVVVITSRHLDVRYAMAATAVCELSMSPPSMLICVNRNASIYAPLSAGADFCINILHSSQKDISVLCSGKARGEDRFLSGRWTETGLGIPRLEDAQASFVCRNMNSHSYGTHCIVVGEILEVSFGQTVDPLIYVDGGYAALGHS